MAIVSMYQRILELVAQIRRSLHRCFIHAAWPWSWTPVGLDMIDDHCEEIGDGIFFIEQDLERSIIGEEYDSILAGKYEEANSQWLGRLTTY